MVDKHKITIAKGDGIGPEIMDATLAILDAAGVQLDFEEIKIGKDVYESGVSSGIEDSSWDTLRRNKVFLKAPITTPQGGGYKSLNVTIRKTLGLYANVRPCVSYHPFITSRSPGMNLTIIRENEEDLYGGIEYRQSQDVMSSIKLISRQGSERISRYAFEYAQKNGSKSVTCMTKDNIMKLSDGLFHSMFNQVGESFPDIEKSHMIIDIGAAKVAAYPEMFEVIVVPNLYGDILSDIGRSWKCSRYSWSRYCKSIRTD
jgi:isocitrate dehydrogenase